MDLLPDDILIEIFSLLPPRDFLAITLVCKIFNDVVSTSTKLLEKFEIKFDVKNIGQEWIGSRRYPRVTLAPKAYLNFIPIVRSIADEITTLSLATNFSLNPGEIAPDENDLVALLFQTPKLKHLKIEFRRFKMAPIIEGPKRRLKPKKPEEKPKLKLTLDSLKVIGGEDFISLFHECQVKSFSVTTFNESVGCELKEFLIRQKRLVALDISSVLGGLFRDEKLIEKFEFELENIKFGKIQGDEVENFVKFLTRQEKTLRQVESDGSNEKTFGVLSKFRNLRNLKINSDSSSFPDVVMTNVEILTISQCANFNEDWAEKFPNLVSLTLIGLHSCTGFESLKMLRSLHIHRALAVPHINIPQVKRLTLTNLKIKNHPRPFCFDSQTLEELHVIEKFYERSEWLKEFKSGGFAKKLKVFTETFEQ